MANNSDIIELLDTLYGMVNEAWGVPLGNDKCIIEREKAIEIINDIKANLPTSIAESKRLVSARDEFIGNAKREAESVRKNAEEQAARMIDQQEIIKIARQRSADMVSAAEQKSAELKRVASDYVDNIMRKVEENLDSALTTIRNAQAGLKNPVEAAIKIEADELAKKQAQIKAEQLNEQALNNLNKIENEINNKYANPDVMNDLMIDIKDENICSK